MILWSIKVFWHLHAYICMYACMNKQHNRNIDSQNRRHMHIDMFSRQHQDIYWKIWIGDGFVRVFEASWAYITNVSSSLKSLLAKLMMENNFFFFNSIGMIWLGKGPVHIARLSDLKLLEFHLIKRRLINETLYFLPSKK